MFIKEKVLSLLGILKKKGFRKLLMAQFKNSFLYVSIPNSNLGKFEYKVLKVNTKIVRLEKIVIISYLNEIV